MAKKTKAEDMQTQLTEYKKNVGSAHEYFRKNYESFWKQKNFTLRTSLTDEERSYLKDIGKPDLEFNVEEAHGSRLIGEFSKQTPSIEVSAADNIPMDDMMLKTIEVADGIIRNIADESTGKGMSDRVYNDQMYGGFSVFEVFTEYPNPMAFDQVIKLRKVRDATLCGFDPIAEEPHKGDGRFAFKIYPKSKEDFKSEYPKIDIGELTFTKNLGGFDWTYNNGKEDILLVCDYYYKKKEPVTIVKVSRPINGKSSMTRQDYEKELKKMSTMDMIEQPPIIVKERETTIEKIYRCRFIENKILETVETDFNMFPLVFVDGNSAMLRKTLDGGMEQVTRGYFYHATGAQRLKNFSGQTLAAQLENIIQSKWVYAIESLPDQKAYQDAILSPQSPRVTLYKSIDPKTGNPLPPPTPIMGAPIPPEISNTFSFCDQTIQAILGSFAAAQGDVSPNDLSGRAVLEAATQSNAAAMPYVMSFLQAWNRVAEIILDLIPKYYVTPRTIPIMGKDNKRTFQVINTPDHPENVNLNYESNTLQVKVEAGVNFSIQKHKALQQIIAMMNVSPIFREFISSPFGMPILLGNLEIKDGDLLREQFKDFSQWKQQQMQQQMQQQQQMMQNDPRFIMAQAKMMDAKANMAETQHEIQHSEVEDQQKAADQAIESQGAQNDLMTIMAKMSISEREALIQMEKMQTEKMGKVVDLSIEASKHHHQMASDHRKHDRDDVALLHTVTHSRAQLDQQKASKND